MKKTRVIFLLLFFYMLSLGQTLEIDKIKQGWKVSGKDRDKYEVGGDPYSIDNPGYIKSNSESFGVWGAYLIYTDPSVYFGKSVKFNVDIRTKNVTGRARIFVRVDKNDGTSIFKNMEEPMVGSNKYRKLSFYINIPHDAKYLVYGMSLSNTGEAYFKNMKFRVNE